MRDQRGPLLIKALVAEGDRILMGLALDDLHDVHPQGFAVIVGRPCPLDIVVGLQLPLIGTDLGGAAGRAGAQSDREDRPH